MPAFAGNTQAAHGRRADIFIQLSPWLLLSASRRINTGFLVSINLHLTLPQ